MVWSKSIEKLLQCIQKRADWGDASYRQIVLQKDFTGPCCDLGMVFHVLLYICEMNDPSIISSSVSQRLLPAYL